LVGDLLPQRALGQQRLEERAALARAEGFGARRERQRDRPRVRSRVLKFVLARRLPVHGRGGAREPTDDLAVPVDREAHGSPALRRSRRMPSADSTRSTTSSRTLGSPCSIRWTERTATLATSASVRWSMPCRRRSARTRWPI